MKCRNCLAENRQDARYCYRCGWWLLPQCPFCQAELLPGVRFCDRCGRHLAATEGFSSLPFQPAAPSPELPAAAAKQELRAAERQGPGNEAAAASPLQKYIPTELLTKLQAARAGDAMVGERRVVTMLFCDVQGSTAAAEQLDPEEWTEIINGAFEHMIKPIYTYEGTVARLMGDAILAFFGAPIAHEDDPERAVLAGLAIVNGIQAYRAQVREQWGIELNVRVGINTGMVVVGTVGSDLRMEYTAMGDAINLAARMEQTASPGTVQVAHETYRLVAPVFDVEELGGIEVKGKSEPTLAYRVLGRRALPGRMRGLAGLQTPLIGRERELASLEQIIAAVRQGVGHLVFVTGDAGIGKSRLARELREASTVPSAAVDWYQTTSFSYEAHQPYAPFRRLIRHVANLEEHDPPETIQRKIAPLIAFLPQARQERALQMLGMLFGIAAQPVEGESFKQEFFGLVSDWLRGQFGSRPVVIQFDDVHWTDPASIALLLHLLPLAAEIPLVLVCLFRPDRDTPAWKLQQTADELYHHRYTRIQLRPLRADESALLLDHLLPGADLPAALRAQILERAGGNPFYIEEIVRSLLDKGILVSAVNDQDGGSAVRWRVVDQSAEVTIPANLRSLLTARIDHLAEEARRTLQMASVIGRTFYERVLAEIDDAGDALESRLATLLRLEMIREAARVPETEYTFRNPLTQEAAYHTILLKQRREFHRRVGEAMERLYPERSEELAVRLAFHFNEAEVYDRAFHYMIIAADAAFRLYANEEAITYYAQAAHIQDRLEVAPAQLSRLYRRWGRALELEGRHAQAMEVYERLLALAQEREDRALELAALLAQGTLYGSWSDQRDEQKAREVADAGLALARETGDRAAEARIYWNLSLSAITSIQPSKAIAYGEQALALARQHNLQEMMAYVLSDMGWSYIARAQLRKAEPLLTEGAALWRELGNLPLLANNLGFTTMLYLHLGALEKADQYARQVLEIVEITNNQTTLATNLITRTELALERGQFGSAWDLLEQQRKLKLSSIYRIMAVASANQVYFALGMLNESSDLLQEAIAQATSSAASPGYWLRVHLARTLLLQGQTEASEALVNELPTDFDMHRQHPQLAELWDLLRVELALAGSRPEVALELAEEALAFAEESGIQLTVPALLLRQGQAHALLDQVPAAREALQEALQVAETRGQRPIIWQILDALSQVEEDPVKANRHRERATSEIDWLAARAAEANRRHIFLNRPDVQRFLQAGQ